MKKTFSATAIALLITGYLLQVTSPVNAQTCTTQYGGTTNCVTTDLSINKQVEYPTRPNVFVENLTEADIAYAANMEVLYRLQITNVTGQTLTNVRVTDVLPQYLTFVSGPGTYNANTRTLTFVIDNLNTGTTNVYVLTKVVGTLPAEKNCEQENTVTITGPDNRTDSDRARICVSRSFSGTSQLPVAGFNDIMLVLPFIGTAFGGMALLRKKS